MFPNQDPNSIQELHEIITKLSDKVTELQKNYDELKLSYESHQHSNTDNTQKTTYGVEKLANSGEIAYLGNGGIVELTLSPLGVETSNNLILAAGRDQGISESPAQSTINSVLNLQNIVAGGAFFFGYNKPAFKNSPQTVTNTQVTLTDATFGWTTNSLAGAYVNVYNSSGALVHTRLISSNTSSVITVSAAWTSTVTAGSYVVFLPIYLGSADNPWRRVYTGEGDTEGIRFGYGVTAGGTNGLLYMDATGDLYWRNKGGTATKLN